MLLRARKHGLVSFEGETLFQGRDDKTIVTLNKDPAEIRQMIYRKRNPCFPTQIDRTHIFIQTIRRMEKESEGSDGFEWGKCLKKSE